MKPLAISLYCVWQWWEQHYQAAYGRPERIDFDWLDATWLGRMRQLHDWFGDLGIGNPSPTLDTGFVSRLLPYHTMIVPVVLGMPATIQQVGGWQNHPLDAERISNLEPVDLADSPVGELLLAEREQRLRRYGRATQMIDLASPSNNAFSLRGTDFYLDLLADQPLARRYLEVITETMVMAYRFLAAHFGRLESVPLGNCNATMMSPDVYADMVDTVAELACWGIDQIAPRMKTAPDMVHVWEDICGKTGPLVSPDIFDECVAPGYRKIREKAEQYGTRLVSIDSDGDVSKLAGHWLDAGVNVLFPVEPGTWKADPMEYRKKYGKELRIVGGLDKLVLEKGPAAIDAEIESKVPLMKDGGFVAMPDHLITPDTSLANYRYHLEAMRALRL